LGKFNANLTIDAAFYIIPVHIVSDALITHDLIIGTDFINKVKMTSIAGKIFTKPLLEPLCIDENVPEIYQINLISEGNNEIDVSHIPKLEHQIKELVTNYNFNKSREIDLKMSIVLKDEKPVHQRGR